MKIDKELKQHPGGFEYTPMENGGISVTVKERIRYTKSTPLRFVGIERDLINDDETYPLVIENFTQCIEDGGKFIQMDMFGRERVVTTRELIEFIKENYQY